MTECCANCKHYTEAYCNLMDELVEPLDNCGMYDEEIKQMKGVIERTTQDIDNETIELYNQIKPLLDNGFSICNAVKKAKGKTTVNTGLSWYRRIRDYAIAQGYPADTDCMYR